MPGLRYALKAGRLDTELPENPTLGHRLRVRRQELGLRRIDAAVRLGVDAKTLLWWERDQHEPIVTHYTAIIAYLGYEPWVEPIGLGQKLLVHRRRCGLSIKAAAEKLGVDEGTWGRWERGDWEPQPYRAKRLRTLLKQSQLEWESAVRLE